MRNEADDIPSARRATVGGIQETLSDYLYAELDHCVGAYASANDKHLASAKARLGDTRTALEVAAETVIVAATRLNKNLRDQRYALPASPDEHHRHPKPPEIKLTEPQEGLVGRFFAVASQAMESASPSPSFRTYT